MEEIVWEVKNVRVAESSTMPTSSVNVWPGVFLDDKNQGWEPFAATANADGALLWLRRPRRAKA